MLWKSELVSAVDLSAETMSQFRASGSKDHLTILLGAGASTSSGLPDWDTFASRLLVSSGAVADSEIAELLMARHEPSRV